MITLGVSDLARSLAFYRDGLGFPSAGIVGTQFPGSATEPAGATAMFTLDDGLVLSLYPRSEIAKDAGVDPARIAGSGVALGHTVERREDVDTVLELARRAGAAVPGPPHERPWGLYAGHFSDPDGHLWEVVHFIPGVGLADDPARATSQPGQPGQPSQDAAPSGILT
ncbi:VOC family protein [Frankia sp. R82]|uniref:VOC family protein n=1 Tax=Frankia sp. R82 TaxID=2950553 RepID=UPI0020431DD7|nr:VOC family protein [Frankia sp. R82]MCM3886868.1 VOC family protein [Frankia sp. R82]